jgi:hypothetical protein
MMRCKVACNLKQPYEDGFYLSFSPVVDGSAENKEFFMYTPGGTVTFNVLNKAAAEKFEVGKQYYVDFTAA